MRHTPGPWRTNNINNPDYMDIDSSSGKRISSVLIIDDGNEDEDKANAQLIAAAPDLLEALEKLVFTTSQKELDAWTEKAKLTIAKVKGI